MRPAQGPRVRALRRKASNRSADRRSARDHQSIENPFDQLVVPELQKFAAVLR